MKTYSPLSIPSSWALIKIRIILVRVWQMTTTEMSWWKIRLTFFIYEKLNWSLSNVEIRSGEIHLWNMSEASETQAANHPRQIGMKLPEIACYFHLSFLFIFNFCVLWVFDEWVGWITLEDILQSINCQASASRSSGRWLPLLVDLSTYSVISATLTSRS